MLSCPNPITNLNQHQSKLQCLPFHNISLTSSFFLYISCISFFWNQAHHTQPQPGVQILYNSAMFSYFNSPFSNTCVALTLPVTAMRKGIARSLVVLIGEYWVTAVSQEPASVLWTTPSTHLEVISQPVKTLSMFLLPVSSLQIWNVSFLLYWLELKACSVQPCIGALGPWLTANGRLTVSSRGDPQLASMAHSTYCLPVKASGILSLTEEFAIYQ